jgi:hypothetical protein
MEEKQEAKKNEVKIINFINEPKDHNNKKNKKEKQSFEMQYFKSFLKIYEDLKNIFQNIEKKLQLKNITKPIISEKNEKIDILTNKIIEIYHNLNYNYLCLIDMIHKKIENYLNEIGQLQNLLNTFEEINKNYQSKKKILSELKENYHTKGKILEKLLIETFDKNENPSNQINNLLNKTIVNLRKYKDSIVDINVCKKQYNEKLNELKEKCSKFDDVCVFDFIKEEISKTLELNTNMIKKIISDIK